MCEGRGSSVQTFGSHTETLSYEPCRWRGAHWGVLQVGHHTHTLHLCSLVTSLFCYTVLLTPSLFFLSHTVNLLGNLPLPCLDVLLMPKVQQGSIEYMGVNMDAVNMLLKFMEKRLDRVRQNNILFMQVHYLHYFNDNGKDMTRNLNYMKQCFKMCRNHTDMLHVWLKHMHSNTAGQTIHCCVFHPDQNLCH